MANKSLGTKGQRWLSACNNMMFINNIVLFINNTAQLFFCQLSVAQSRCCDESGETERAGGRPWCHGFIVSTCYTTAGGKACQRLTQERFVMVLTDCDSLFFSAVHWGGFLVRRSHGRLLHPWEWFRLLFRGRLKENLLIDRPLSERVHGNNFVINQGVCEASPSAGCCSLAELPDKWDLSSCILFLLTFGKLLWYQTDDSRAEIIIWWRENWAATIWIISYYFNSSIKHKCQIFVRCSLSALRICCLYCFISSWVGYFRIFGCQTENAIWRHHLGLRGFYGLNDLIKEVTDRSANNESNC